MWGMRLQYEKSWWILPTSTWEKYLILFSLIPLWVLPTWGMLIRNNLQWTIKRRSKRSMACTTSWLWYWHEEPCVHRFAKALAWRGHMCKSTWGWAVSFGAEASRPSRSNATSKVCWLGQSTCHHHATVGSIVSWSSDSAHVPSKCMLEAYMEGMLTRPIEVKCTCHILWTKLVISVTIRFATKSPPYPKIGFDHSRCTFVFESHLFTQGSVFIACEIVHFHIHFWCISLGCGPSHHVVWMLVGLMANMVFDDW